LRWNLRRQGIDPDEISEIKVLGVDLPHEDFRRKVLQRQGMPSFLHPGSSAERGAGFAPTGLALVEF
jgi:hypothetical protein